MVAALLWMGFVVLTVGFIWIAVFNVASLLPVWGGRRPSLCPLIGGCMGVAAFTMSPIRALHFYWWLPLLLDVSIPIFLLFLPRLLFDAWQLSRWNLLVEYQSAGVGNGTVILRLFRRGACLLRTSYLLQPGEAGVAESSILGTWTREEGRLVVRACGGELRFRVAGERELALEGMSGQEMTDLLAGAAVLRLLAS